jgi:capsular polysaccharide biosynthesis protein
MGVYDPSGDCIEETLIRRRFSKGKERQIGVRAPPSSSSIYHDINAIYAGPLLNHFGHFLLEGLARIWFARRHPEIPIVWSCPSAEQLDPSRPAMTKWQNEILALLGVNNPRILVQSPARFKSLHIPEVGYVIQDYFHPEHMGALAVTPHTPKRGHNVWLSRSKLNQFQNLSIAGFEQSLVHLGWTIIYPETLAIAEQMSHLASAERVAGEEGSALHSLIFLKTSPDLRVDIFRRDPTRASRSL